MQSINILIVEDEPIIAADLEDRLTHIGYQVPEIFASGEEAIAYVQHTQPDLILMDVNLEGTLNGIETTQKIKAQYDIPVIFLTSNSDEATFAAAKETSPAAFLSKPFRGRDLQHAIELAIVNTAQNKAPASEAPASQEEMYVLKDRLFIKEKERMVRLFIEDIIYVEANDYYCKVHTAGKCYLISMTLKRFQTQITSKELVRIHRSYIANIKHIQELSELYVHFSKAKIPIGKTYRKELMKHFKSI